MHPYFRVCARLLLSTRRQLMTESFLSSSGISHARLRIGPGGGDGKKKRIRRRALARVKGSKKRKKPEKNRGLSICGRSKTESKWDSENVALTVRRSKRETTVDARIFLYGIHLRWARCSFSIISRSLLKPSSGKMSALWNANYGLDRSMNSYGYSNLTSACNYAFHFFSVTCSFIEIHTSND